MLYVVRGDARPVLLAPCNTVVNMCTLTRSECNLPAIATPLHVHPHCTVSTGEAVCGDARPLLLSPCNTTQPFSMHTTLQLSGRLGRAVNVNVNVNNVLLMLLLRTPL